MKPNEPEISGHYALAIETSGALGGVALGRGGEVLAIRMLTGEKPHAVDLLPSIAALCSDLRIAPFQIQRVYVSSGPGSFTGLRIATTVGRMIALANEMRQPEAQVVDERSASAKRAADARPLRTASKVSPRGQTSEGNTGGVQLVAVPTLEVIAHNALEHAPPLDCVAVFLDAKRSHVYAAAFMREGNRYVALDGPVETDAEQFLSKQNKALEAGKGGPMTNRPSRGVLGDGARLYRNAVERAGWTLLPEGLNAPRPETVYRLGFQRAQSGRIMNRRDLIPTYVRPPEAEEKWKARRRPNAKPGR